VFKTLVDDELGEYTTTLHILGMMRIQERGIPTSQYNTGWWFGTCFFPYIGNFIIPTDYFSEGLKPPTRIALTAMTQGFWSDSFNFTVPVATRRSAEKSEVTEVSRCFMAAPLPKGIRRANM
jgi:hypothetical protein